MLNTPILYITIPYSIIGDDTKISYNYENRIGVNILIDKEDIDIKNIINYVSKLDYYYILTLSGEIINNAGTNNLLPKLYSLFTLSGSFMKNNKVIPVFTNIPEDQTAGQKIIKDYFQQQGEQNIELVPFNSDETQVRKSILLSDLTSLKLLNDVELGEYRSKEINQIIISFKNTAQLKNEMDLVASVLQDNKYTKLFFEMTTLRMNSNWLLHQSGLWEERAKLYLSFLSIIKKIDKAQYYELQQWYEKEYEILPVWYKRVGHIIKVLTGKRTFRSLFNDNTSKYKN